MVMVATLAGVVNVRVICVHADGLAGTDEIHTYDFAPAAVMYSATSSVVTFDWYQSLNTYCVLGVTATGVKYHLASPLTRAVTSTRRLRLPLCPVVAHVCVAVVPAALYAIHDAGALGFPPAATSAEGFGTSSAASAALGTAMARNETAHESAAATPSLRRPSIRLTRPSFRRVPGAPQSTVARPRGG
jgi:hypothetical protein